MIEENVVPTKFEEFHWGLEESLSGVGPIEVTPKIKQIFEVNATDIYVFRRLGGTYEQLVEYFATLGYKTTAATLRYYSTHLKNKIDHARAQKIIEEKTAIRPRSASARSSIENTPAQSQPAQGKTAAQEPRARRLGNDASVTMASEAPEALQAENNGLSTRETAGAGSFSSNLSGSAKPAKPAPAGVPGREPTKIEPTPEQLQDLQEIDNVQRSYAEFRQAVRDHVAVSKTAMVAFEDGKTFFVPTALQQKIIAGMIDSWDAYFKQA